MKYALRTIRNTETGEVTVFPVIRVRNSARPYRLKYPETYTAERLQLFDTLQEAERARNCEEIAADIVKRPEEGRIAMLRSVIAEFHDMGIPYKSACKLTGASYESIRSYLCRGYPPNGRIVARMYLGLIELKKAVAIARETLPHGN